MPIYCGDLTVTGTATGITSSGNVAFPAIQSASTDANTLDDYEEGGWTPIITRSGSAPSISYSHQTGWYRKIGSVCNAGFIVQVATNGLTSDGSGSWLLGGLPFASSSTGKGHGIITVTANHSSSGYGSDDAAPWALWLDNSSSAAVFKAWDADSNGLHRGQVQDLNTISNEDSFQGLIHYFTA